MLRISADCSEVPSETMNAVAGVGQNSGRHIRQVYHFIYIIRHFSYCYQALRTIYDVREPETSPRQYSSQCTVLIGK